MCLEIAMAVSRAADFAHMMAGPTAVAAVLGAAADKDAT